MAGFALAFLGVIFALGRWITRLADHQPSEQSESGFAIWSQDAPGEPRAPKSRANQRTVRSYSNPAFSDTYDDLSRAEKEMNTIPADWERTDPQPDAPTAISPGPDGAGLDENGADFSSSSDMGGLESADPSDSNSGSSDMGGLDN